MGHWKRLIKIPGGTDCYYCMNNMTCPIHVSYWLVALVISPDHLSLIMLPVYFVPFLIHVTLSVVAHYPYASIFCITYTLLYVCLANIITVYAQPSSMVLLHAIHLHVPYLLLL